MLLVYSRWAAPICVAVFLGSGVARAYAASVTTSTSGDNSELDELRRAAASLADPYAESVAPLQIAESTPSLSALNPELSAIADVAALLVPKAPHVRPDARSGFLFRELELDLRANVDPQSRLRATVSIGPEGVEIEEGTFTWSGLVTGLSLAAGRFRQSLGTVNRWHLHGLDQFELPRVFRDMLGDEGLAQTGLRAEWRLPMWPTLPIGLVVEATNSENEALFAGPDFAAPALLTRVEAHAPIGAVGYAELGLAAVHGYHHTTKVLDDVARDDGGAIIETSGARATDLFSLDWNVGWDPPGGLDRFRLFARGQWLHLVKETTSDARQGQNGAFAYVNAHLTSRWEIGVRGDWSGDLAKTVVDVFDAGIVGVAPYVTFWQSEFLRVRLEARREAPFGASTAVLEDLVVLSLSGAVGPHRHDRY